MIGRFLIVVTFLEDALRIMTQWGDQLIYLKDYRKSMFNRPENLQTDGLRSFSLVKC